jgi:predicted pyridoxine 5'-phosphate oxidase superfamily flavin-nucleotide-binding protein
MKIPQKVTHLFDTTCLVSFGTADSKGSPNVNAVFWKKITDRGTILLLNNFMKTTVINLLENNQVCLSFWDAKTEEGYKIKGTAVHYTEGAVFEEGKQYIQLKNPNRIPKGVIEITVKNICILTPGPKAGEKLNSE